MPLYEVAYSSSSADPLEEDLLGSTAGKALSDARGGTSSLSQAIFNLTNTIVGAGIIGLPFAVKLSGLGCGIVLLVLMGALTAYSLELLIGTALRHGKKSYEDLCISAFGAVGLLVVSVSRFMFSGMAMVSYLIILGDTLSAVLDAAGSMVGDEATTRHVVIGTSSVLLLLPLALLRDITHLSRAAILSISTVFAMEVVVVAQAATNQRALFEKSCSGEDHLCEEAYAPGEGPAYKIEPVVGAHLFSAFGIFATAFTCHDSSFIILSSMRERTMRAWRFTTRVSVAIAAVLCALMAFGGYLTFSSRTDADLLNNYPSSDALIMAVRVMYAMTMVLTYPMCFNVCRDVLHGLWVMGGKMWRRRQRRLRRERALAADDDDDDEDDGSYVSGDDIDEWNDKQRRQQKQMQMQMQPGEADESGVPAEGQDTAGDGGAGAGAGAAVAAGGEEGGVGGTIKREGSPLSFDEDEDDGASIASVPYPTDIAFIPHLCFTLPLFVVSVVIGIAVTDLGIVMQLNGGLAATTVAFILPAACALKLDHIEGGGGGRSSKGFRDWDWRATIREDPGPALLLVFGVVAMVVSTSDTLMSAK